MLFWYLALPISFFYIFEIFKKRNIRVSAAGYILEHTRNLLLKFPLNSVYFSRENILIFSVCDLVKYK